MRLIDADKLVKEFSERVEMYKDERSFSKAAEASAARCIVRTATTVDAVEVVRCKDCVSCEPVPKALRWMYLDNCIHCCAHDTIMLPDGFCSNGERKDGEQNAAD